MLTFAGSMESVIQLLSDHVANQIAAGEVIQRPASAVKELLENAVDAGAKNIQLLIRDGGRSLIQVIDNGKGMTEFDARLCFARHATSKLRQADDLFALRTMGFRGEALASIAAVAQVELRTRPLDSETGTLIRIEGTEILSQEPVSTPIGTSIAVKNLFFNVPARRNFLKSNPVETKHIIEEFTRVALAFPEIAFSFVNGTDEVYRLMAGTFKQRIVSLMGNIWNEKLLMLREETPHLKVYGFVGKPDVARKSRGDQYFFINNRFVKHSYLHHAVTGAFQDLIPDGDFPVYFIRFEVDPSSIDVNIHPTKTEVKFADDRLIYGVLRSAVKKALGSHILSPSLDFDTERPFDTVANRSTEIKIPRIQVNPDYNPFDPQTHQSASRPSSSAPDSIRQMSRLRWEDVAGKPAEQSQLDLPATEEKVQPWLLHQRYICCQVKSGLMLIDYHGAEERIRYEMYMKRGTSHGVSQQLLFPAVLEMGGADFELVVALQPELRALGFDLEVFGKHTFKLNGVPPEALDADQSALIDALLEQFKKNNLNNLQLNRLETLAAGLARQSVKKLQANPSSEALSALVDRLFACETPGFTPSGRQIISMIALEELAQRFSIPV
jgi:DNA mismatch repair protein MutL